MKRQGIFLRTVKSRNRGRASERAVCGVFSDFSLAEPASRPAYAPAATSPARYRTGRSKQHHHARNVKPLPPSGESEAGSARSLVRPIFLCCSLYLAPWRFPRLLSSPWPDLQAAQPTHLQQKARRGIGPGGPSSTILPETQHPLPPRRSPGRTLPGQEGVKGDTCLSPSPFSLPFGKKRKNPRSSMLCSSNKHRLLPLLSAPPTFLTSPRTCS